MNEYPSRFLSGLPKKSNHACVCPQNGLPKKIIKVPQLRHWVEDVFLYLQRHGGKSGIWRSSELQTPDLRDLPSLETREVRISDLQKKKQDSADLPTPIPTLIPTPNAQAPDRATLDKVCIELQVMPIKAMDRARQLFGPTSWLASICFFASWEKAQKYVP